MHVLMLLLELAIENSQISRPRSRRMNKLPRHRGSKRVQLGLGMRKPESVLSLSKGVTVTERLRVSKSRVGML